jgi:hypothetical protein
MARHRALGGIPVVGAVLTATLVFVRALFAWGGAPGVAADEFLSLESTT